MRPSERVKREESLILACCAFGMGAVVAGFASPAFALALCVLALSMIVAAGIAALRS